MAPSQPLRVAFGADEHSVLTEAVLADLLELGQQVLVVADGEPWPEVTRGVAGKVAAGEADLGLLCCGNPGDAAGAANEVAGVRAAVCASVEAVRAARGTAAANVLVLDVRGTTPAAARQMVAAFVAT